MWNSSLFRGRRNVSDHIVPASHFTDENIELGQRKVIFSSEQLVNISSETRTWAPGLPGWYFFDSAMLSFLGL